MRLVQSGQPFSFNYTAYDQNAGLFVAFNVYDVTTGTAVFVTKINSSYDANGVYLANYTGAATKTYLIIGVVYTSNTYATVDTTRSTSTDVYQSIQTISTYFGFAYATYDLDASLFIQAAVNNLSTGSPVLDSTVDMTLVAFGVYFGSFTGTVGDTYQAVQVVYTDGSYTTPDTSRAPNTDGFDSIVLLPQLVVGGSANLTVGQSEFSNSIAPEINITQGDTSTLTLIAVDGNGNPIDLTGASFATLISGPNLVGPVDFSNSQHTANPDQVNFRGYFTLALSGSDTDSLGVDVHKAVLTFITISGGTVCFRGPNILQVYAPVPFE